MGGLVRKPVPVVGARVVMLYADGHEARAELDEVEAAGMLEGLGYVPPTRYAERRDVLAFTDYELGEALEMYAQGMEWGEIGEAYGVEGADLKRRVHVRYRDGLRRAQKERTSARNRRIVQLHVEGMGQMAIARVVGTSQATVSRVVGAYESGRRPGY